MAAFIPEAQTLLMAVHGTPSGIPAPKQACLAGAWCNSKHFFMSVPSLDLHLTETGTHDIANQSFVDVTRIHAALMESASDRYGSQFGRTQ